MKNNSRVIKIHQYNQTFGTAVASSDIKRSIWVNFLKSTFIWYLHISVQNEKKKLCSFVCRTTYTNIQKCILTHTRSYHQVSAFIILCFIFSNCGCAIFLFFFLLYLFCLLYFGQWCTALNGKLCLKYVNFDLFSLLLWLDNGLIKKQKHLPWLQFHYCHSLLTTLFVYSMQWTLLNQNMCCL